MSHVERVLQHIPHPPAVVFRGQPDATFGLTPTLLRHFLPGVSARRALRIEDLALDEFLSPGFALVGLTGVRVWFTMSYKAGSLFGLQLPRLSSASWAIGQLALEWEEERSKAFLYT